MTKTSRLARVAAGAAVLFFTATAFAEGTFTPELGEAGEALTRALLRERRVAVEAPGSLLVLEGGGEERVRGRRRVARGRPLRVRCSVAADSRRAATYSESWPKLGTRTDWR